MFRIRHKFKTVLSGALVLFALPILFSACTGEREEQMIREVLIRHGLNQDLSKAELRRANPAAYEELKQAGYAGSAVLKKQEGKTRHYQRNL